MLLRSMSVSEFFTLIQLVGTLDRPDNRHTNESKDEKTWKKIHSLCAINSNVLVTLYGAQSHCLCDLLERLEATWYLLRYTLIFSLGYAIQEWCVSLNISCINFAASFSASILIQNIHTHPFQFSSSLHWHHWIKCESSICRCRCHIPSLRNVYACIYIQIHISIITRAITSRLNKIVKIQ